MYTHIIPPPLQPSAPPSVSIIPSRLRELGISTFHISQLFWSPVSEWSHWSRLLLLQGSRGLAREWAPHEQRLFSFLLILYSIAHFNMSLGYIIFKNPANLPNRGTAHQTVFEWVTGLSSMDDFEVSGCAISKDKNSFIGEFGVNSGTCNPYLAPLHPSFVVLFLSLPSPSSLSPFPLISLSLPLLIIWQLKDVTTNLDGTTSVAWMEWRVQPSMLLLNAWKDLLGILMRSLLLFIYLFIYFIYISIDLLIYLCIYFY